MAAKFEIRSPKPGEFNWVLLSQGRTLATGASYTSKALAEKSIASMRLAAPGAPVVDLTLPPSRTAATAARSAGRALGRAVVKGGQTVEQVENTVATAAAGATEVAKKSVKKAKAKVKKATAKAKTPKAKRAKAKTKKSGR